MGGAMATLQVRVNGVMQSIPEGFTLQGLIERYRLKEQAVVLELNRQVIPRSSYRDTDLRDYDTVEIVRFVGGG